MTFPSNQAIFDEAYAAGHAAGQAAHPTPMIVGQPTNVLGNDIDPSKPVYYVSDGVCGFAWVNVRPGNSAFAKWMVKTGRARKDSYAGGVRINIHDFNQSLTRKKACASAMAKVLTGKGIQAYADSRMD